MSSNKIQPIFNVRNVLPYTHYKHKFERNSFTSSTTTFLSRKSHKKKRNPLTLKAIQNWFMQNLRNYCNTTSLHGFNYLTRSDMTKKERYFWLFVVIVSIIVSIVLVIVSYLWNRETPTVTVIESSHHPTWDIPFPAVTFCNFNKISRDRALSLVKVLKLPSNTSEEEVLRSFRVTMYYSFALNQSNVNFTLAEKILELNNMTLSDLSERLSPNCLDMISKCIWKGTNSRCDSLFQRIPTIEGVCCSFNYFGQAKNNFPEKIAYQVPKRPYRVTGCGYPTGLSILLNPLAYDYFGTYFSSYGFRFMIHDAYDFPDENAETKVITSTRESFVRISPESTYATSDVKSMDLKLRNCLFSNERQLVVMQRYSFINCMSECRIRKAVDKCGCVPENLPNNGSFPKCGIKELQCVLDSREIFTRALNEYNKTFSTILSTDKFPCDCLPDCESNHYVSEITMGKLNVKLSFQQENDLKVPNDYNNILLHVFYSDLMSTRYRKEIYQNWLSALASFGGLLGLIMGFSIVTAFEFIYFLTFRPIFNYFNNR
ncbi:pickpocket protein 11-like [Calliphora vicina]|uniref:pickpocket protein 11-like n=1 Tax=Calliphora vicina TaxID=7373 RepID=UPI00325B1613